MGFRFLAALAITFLIVGGFQAPVARAEELHDRQQIMIQAAGLLQAGRFAEFEKVRAGYLAAQSRTGSGTWKLYYFDMGAMQYLGEGENRSDCSYPRKAVLDRWQAALPRSVTPKILRGRLAGRASTCWRGNGPYASIPAARKRAFREASARAEAQLLAIKAEADRDPNWYAAMAGVVVYSGWDKDRVKGLIEQGARANPAYFALYFDYAIYFLPRWYGSEAEIESYVRWAAGHAASRDEGDALYMRTYWALISDHENGQLPANLDWPRMRRGMAVIDRAYPDPWNRANFSRFACLANDDATASRYLPKALLRFDGQPVPWGNDAELQACLVKIEIWRRAN